MHEALDQGHGPSLPLQQFSNLINLERDLLCHELLKELGRMVNGAGHGPQAMCCL